MSADEALTRAEELLERLRTLRAEVDQLAGSDDPDAAVEVLNELAELAKQVEVELQRARARADAGA